MSRRFIKDVENACEIITPRYVHLAHNIVSQYSSLSAGGDGDKQKTPEEGEIIRLSMGNQLHTKVDLNLFWLGFIIWNFPTHGENVQSQQLIATDLEFLKNCWPQTLKI